MPVNSEYIKRISRGESDLCPDPRYTSQNVTYWCYRSFLDYHKCLRLMGKSHKPCLYFRSAYGSLCPNEWVREWDQQLKDGNFPGMLPPDPDHPE